MNKNFDFILRELKKWDLNGTRRLDNGSILICNVPHIAPQAWFHEIYAPLHASNIKDIETSLKLDLPSEYTDFLQECNGINIFSDSLSIWGMKMSYKRAGDEAYQPYDLIELNNERRGFMPSTWVIVGSYSWDGSLIAYDLNDTTKVFRCNGETYEVLNEWNDLRNFLESEISRLTKMFDKKGMIIDKGLPTTPA